MYTHLSWQVLCKRLKQKINKKARFQTSKYDHCLNVKFNSRHDCGQMRGSNVHTDTRIFVPWSCWSGNSAWLMYEEAVVQFPTGSPLPSDHSVERELQSVQVKGTPPCYSSGSLRLTTQEREVWHNTKWLRQKASILALNFMAFNHNSLIPLCIFLRGKYLAIVTMHYHTHCIVYLQNTECTYYFTHIILELLLRYKCLQENFWNIDFLVPVYDNIFRETHYMKV